jgi:sulfite dehydrogenase
MDVRSFITSVQEGGMLKGNMGHTIRGLAFDGGYGIKKVLFTTDGGQTWMDAALGKDHGKYSFRQWEAHFSPKKGHDYKLGSLAFNQIGESQRFAPRWNPAGYMRNVVEMVNVKAM